MRPAPHLTRTRSSPARQERQMIALRLQPRRLVGLRSELPALRRRYHVRANADLLAPARCERFVHLGVQRLSFFFVNPRFLQKLLAVEGRLHDDADAHRLANIGITSRALLSRLRRMSEGYRLANPRCGGFLQDRCADKLRRLSIHWVNDALHK